MNTQSNSINIESYNFQRRHIGPYKDDITKMLKTLGYENMDNFIAETIPPSMLAKTEYNEFAALSENEALKKLKTMVKPNKVFTSLIGKGYYGTLTPTVILRNIFENPAWYTAYTPYQAEISQGRMEALLNYQTMVSELTGLPLANASLLDEGTAAAEAVSLCWAQQSRKKKTPLLIVDELIFDQTKEVLETRCKPLDIKIVYTDVLNYEFTGEEFAFIYQYPNSKGVISNIEDKMNEAKSKEVFGICCTDLLALTLIKPPGELGFDIAVGTSQRFGVPFGFGGPHAAFFSTHDKFKRNIPGRIIGVSKDTKGNPALRLALQTREQHIRREKATSNICTSQVLLAVMAGMYAVYHGPQGLTKIATKVASYTQLIKKLLVENGFSLIEGNSFDTITITKSPLSTSEVKVLSEENQINFRYDENGDFGFTIDETFDEDQLEKIMTSLKLTDLKESNESSDLAFGHHKRSTSFMNQSVFNSYQSETELLRYINILQAKDLSLVHSMIPLGSCTMKLNATSEMIPVTWPEIGDIHPFAPENQTLGYTNMINDLEKELCNITGYTGISFQPNAGSQGEYTGLLMIRAYHEDRGESQRNICLIPSSAHGTNPASAVMAGFKVVVVQCDSQGNIDLEDLQSKAELHKDSLGALMITYPSTHGVFEEGVANACSIIHKNGGMVYLDGANMNALVGMVKAPELGLDVCHLNLHKTFCIPHGGGGPGVGPVCANETLAPYLPKHQAYSKVGGEKGIQAVSAAPFGSSSILPISWMYLQMMGFKGLKNATEMALLNANYIAARLSPYYKVLYTGENGRVAHECIIDVRPFKQSAGVSVDDIAKRLMDYGFHAPTMSWPVVGTLMIEPTESESLKELDEFCDAMISIYKEIQKIEKEEWPKDNNPLSNAPHTFKDLIAADWTHPYSRKTAVDPIKTNKNKFWPSVNRVDNAFGDRNLVCTCPDLSEYES